MPRWHVHFHKLCVVQYTTTSHFATIE